MTRPALRIVRATDPPPPLEQAPPIAPRLVVIERPRPARWIDGVAAGLLFAGTMLVGVVLVCIAMGWLRP